MPHFPGHCRTFHAATFIHCKQLKTLLLTVLEQINSDLLQRHINFLSSVYDAVSIIASAQAEYRWIVLLYLYVFHRICKMQFHSYSHRRSNTDCDEYHEPVRVSKLRGDLRATELKLTLSRCIIGPLSRAAARLCF